MANRTSTWAVVATVDEPPMLVAAFVAWHLSLGASEVTVYFDRPDDPAADLIAPLHGVRVIRCDAAHWRRLGKRRPDKHEIRQIRNAAQAYRQLDADWLLHCDADEFVWPQTSVAASLDKANDQAQCVVIPVAERIYHDQISTDSIFAGLFRRPFKGKPATGRKLFGRGYAMTQRGLSGHAVGKSFLRKGCTITPALHRAKPLTAADVVVDRAQAMELLHFDGLTPLHWIYKILRQVDAVLHHNGKPPSPHRQRQTDALLADPSMAFALHDRLKRLNGEQLRSLASAGQLLKANFAPQTAIDALLPGADLALAPRDLNDWLWAHKASLLHQIGLERDA